MTKAVTSVPTVIVIFGASGDLTRRKIVPALYNLFLDGWLPEQFAIFGVARTHMTDEAFCSQLRDGVRQHSRRKEFSEEDWSSFAAHIKYHSVIYDDAQGYALLLAELNQGWQKTASHIFYVATPPGQFPVISRILGNHKVFQHRTRARIVLEKPFGHDLESAQTLNSLLTRYCHESQIYRIDHYLGKETVQNILAFRFANAMWEPIWNRRYIDYIQITVAEKLGVEHRGGYYEHAGALRDMVQNHLLQILCLIAMEPPISFDADEVRNKKVDVLHALRPITHADVVNVAVRGQYDKGRSESAPLRAYRNEADVAPDSNVETFAAIKFYVDNWRWQGVPFYLRTGKRMPDRVSEVSVQLRPVPHQPFPKTARAMQANRLAIQMEPVEGILLRTQAKEPGQGMVLKPVEMHYSYREVFHKPSPDAYETLLLDIIRGDASLFMRADQVKAAWAAIRPIMEVWDSVKPEFPNYQAGTWGPQAAEDLIRQDGHSWLTPACLESVEK